ncbi:hypothetical protein [Fulvimonas yonginensis]|uniref:Thioredoxin domain-containing protein n=1 Tax=Fulvimonas yonginensis TaxID=1495200 RepID=A0ABU8JB66_9GAMM
MPRILRFAWLCSWIVAGAALAGTTPSNAPAGVTVAPALRWPAAPIASAAALDAYLRGTPPAASPLSAFTADGRRRFLASLTFHEHGLGGFSTDDLTYELTRAQAWNVLRLFGEQAYASGLPARTRPRPPDDRPATLAAAYDRLATLQPDDAALVALYAEAFAPARARLARLDDADVELLFRAAGRLAHGRRADPGYLADMQHAFAELDRRGRVDRPHADALYEALLAAHRTEAARALLASRPNLDRRPPPVMRTARLRAGQASVWIAHGSHELWRLPLMLRDTAQVVVMGSPHCHFSGAAARDIDADPVLRALFGAHAQWIAPASDITDFAALLAWNHTHPQQRLAIANDDAELPFVGTLETPVFYFLRHGDVVATLVGWPGPDQRERLRAQLRSLGLLRPPSTPPDTR